MDELDLPKVTAEVTFLSENEGGRTQMPDLTGRYMPHLVVGSPDQRQALSKGYELTEDYLGVSFISGPEFVRPDHPITIEMELMYYPNVDYSALVPGATFTIREGPSIVGYGRVMERKDEPG